MIKIRQYITVEGEARIYPEKKYLSCETIGRPKCPLQHNALRPTHHTSTKCGVPLIKVLSNRDLMGYYCKSCNVFFLTKNVKAIFKAEFTDINGEVISQ